MCNSLEEAVIHEVGHAMAGARMSHEQLLVLNNAKGYNEISTLAGEDLLETLAEVKVLKFRGETDKISDRAMKLYGKHIGDF